MSCALARVCESGGRRSTYSLPLASVRWNVRFECPPAMTREVNGGVNPATFAASHGVTVSTLMPSRAASTMRRNYSPPHAPPRVRHQSVLVRATNCHCPCSGIVSA